MSCVHVSPAHGYASTRTLNVRGLVPSMWSTSEGQDWTYLSHCVVAKSGHSYGARGWRRVAVAQWGWPTLSTCP